MTGPAYPRHCHQQGQKQTTINNQNDYGQEQGFQFLTENAAKNQETD